MLSISNAAVGAMLASMFRLYDKEELRPIRYGVTKMLSTGVL